MLSQHAFRRFARLDTGNQVALAEAFLVLAAASLAIRLAPFRQVVRFAASRPRQVRGADVEQARRMRQARWAVQRVADRVPWRAVCFQRGLALHLMLRRRGVPSYLHYGVAKDEAKGLAAHVWISSGGETVLGGETADRFACLATFPSAQRSRAA